MSIPTAKKCYCSLPGRNDMSVLLHLRVGLSVSLNIYFLTLGFSFDVFVFPHFLSIFAELFSFALSILKSFAFC